MWWACYCTIRGLGLFAGLVWREWDEGYRLSIATAWAVSRIVYGGGMTIRDLLRAGGRLGLLDKKEKG